MSEIKWRSWVFGVLCFGVRHRVVTEDKSEHSQGGGQLGQIPKCPVTGNQLFFHNKKGWFDMFSLVPNHGNTSSSFGTWHHIILSSRVQPGTHWTQADVREGAGVKKKKSLIVTIHFSNGWQGGRQDDIVTVQPGGSQQPRQGQGRRDG